MLPANIEKSMNWENVGIAIAALIIFLFNEWKRERDKKKEKENNNKAKEEIKGVVRAEIKKANGVPFSFIQNMPLPTWCKDVDGRMIWINEEYTKQWGIKSTEYEGNFDSEIWGTEIAKEYRKNDLEVIISKATIRTVEPVPENPRDPNTPIVDWHIWKFPVFDDYKNVIAVGGVAKRVIDNND